MAFGSRIQSEPVRRVVLAGLMALTLICSTAAARWLSSARTHRNHPALRSENLGVFRMARPALWSSMPPPPASADSPLEPLAAWFDDGDDQRRLLVYQFHTAVPATPEAVLNASVQWLERQDAIVRGASPVGSPTMNGRTIEGLEFYSDSPFEKFLLADLTTDGHFHVLLYLHGLGEPSFSDFQLLDRMADTLVDLRYRVMTPPIELGGLRIELPRRTVALRSVEDEDEQSVEILPTGSPEFFRMRLGYHRLSELDLPPPSSSEGATAPGALRQLVSRSREGSPDDRLLALQAIQYWKATGKMPSPGSFQRFAHGQATGLAVTVSGGRGPTHRAIWSVRLDQEQAVVLDLMASRSGAQHAYMTGQMVLRGLGVMARTPEAPQAPAPSPTEPGGMPPGVDPTDPPPAEDRAIQPK
jgi:hypothetical protein